MSGESYCMNSSRNTHLLNKVFVISQPKAGTYLMANILMELGYGTGNIDTFQGIKHISRGKVEIYPLPGCAGFEEARKFPEKYRLMQGFSRSVDTILKGEFAVAHVRPEEGMSHYKIRTFKKIFLERSTQGIEQSLFRWDSYSGRSPSNKKDVLRQATRILQWKNSDYHGTGGLFQLTFDDMKNYDVEKIDQLQKFLGIVDLYDSKSVLQKALSKDSITKVK